MNFGRRLLFYDLPVLLYAALIFWLSHRTYTPIERQWLTRAPDKVLHLVEFGIFGVLVFRWIHCAVGVKTLWKVSLWTLLTVGLYAASDEIHQHFRPDRIMSFEDWLADMAGTALGVGFWLAVQRVKKKWLTGRNTL